MTRIVDAYFGLLKATLALCLAAMVVLVFGNVALRYLLNTGITVSEELSRLLFVWLTFLGAIVAMRERGHLGMDMLVQRLPLAGKKLCLSVSLLLMLYVSWLLLEGSWQQTLINLEVGAPATGVPMAAWYGAGVVFAASTMLILLHDLYLVATGRRSEAELVMVKESEELEEIEALHELSEPKPRPGAAGAEPRP